MSEVFATIVGDLRSLISHLSPFSKHEKDGPYSCLWCSESRHDKEYHFSSPNALFPSVSSSDSELVEQNQTSQRCVLMLGQSENQDNKFYQMLTSHLHFIKLQEKSILTSCDVLVLMIQPDVKTLPTWVSALKVRRLVVIATPETLKPLFNLFPRSPKLAYITHLDFLLITNILHYLSLKTKQRIRVDDVLRYCPVVQLGFTPRDCLFF